MKDKLFSVAGQVVLVSGGTRGIGKAIARGFAERGARVVITGRNQESAEAAAQEITSDGEPVRPMVCDVADSRAVAKLVDRCVSDFGRIDTLVNSAGVNQRKPAAEVTEEEYDFVVGVNLKGSVLLCQAVGKQMIRQGKGSQINIGSLTTHRPLKNLLPYAVSKAGVGQLTRLLALEWGSEGVRVNGIAPGFILTDLSRKLWSDERMKSWVDSNTPQGRLGQPEDMIGTAVFLASEASAFMTGQMLYVDGGFESGWSWPIPS